MRWALLACDYDRTLTEHPRGLHPRVPEAFRAAQRAGVRVAVCSGQPLDKLRERLPGLDAYVAENGCIVAVGDRAPWVHAWPERPAVIAALEAARIPHESFDVVFDVDRAHEAALARALRPEHRCVAMPNVDRINLQPLDASKGRGLRELQALLGIAREATVAVGDGENDLALFRQAGLACAVANATPQAKGAADRVLELPDGEGVCALVEELLAGRVEARRPLR